MPEIPSEYGPNESQETQIKVQDFLDFVGTAIDEDEKEKAWNKLSPVIQEAVAKYFTSERDDRTQVDLEWTSLSPDLQHSIQAVLNIRPQRFPGIKPAEKQRETPESGIDTYIDSERSINGRRLEIKVKDPKKGNQERSYIFDLDDPNDRSQNGLRNKISQFLSKYGENYREVFRSHDFPVDGLVPPEGRAPESSEAESHLVAKATNRAPRGEEGSTGTREQPTSLPEQELPYFYDIQRDNPNPLFERISEVIGEDRSFFITDSSGVATRDQINFDEMVATIRESLTQIGGDSNFYWTEVADEHGQRIEIFQKTDSDEKQFLGTIRWNEATRKTGEVPQREKAAAPEHEEFLQNVEYYENYDFNGLKDALFDLRVDYIHLGSEVLRVKDAEPYLSDILEARLGEGRTSRKGAPISRLAKITRREGGYDIAIYFAQADEEGALHVISEPVELTSASYKEFHDHEKALARAKKDQQMLDRLEGQESRTIEGLFRNKISELSNSAETQRVVEDLRENGLTDEVVALVEKRMEEIIKLVISEKSKLEKNRDQRYRSEPIDALMSAYRFIQTVVFAKRSSLSTGEYLALWGYPKNLAAKLGDRSTGPNKRLPEALSAYIEGSQQTILERVMRSHAKDLGIDAAKIILTSGLNDKIGGELKSRYGIKSRHWLITRREIPPNLTGAITRIKEFTGANYTSGEIRTRPEIKRLNELRDDLEMLPHLSELTEQHDQADKDFDHIMSKLFAYAKNRKLTFTYSREDDEEIEVNAGDFKDMDDLFNPDEKTVPEKYIASYVQALMTALQIYLNADLSARDNIRIIPDIAKGLILRGPSSQELKVLQSYFDPDSELNLHAIQEAMMTTFESDITLDLITVPVSETEKWDDASRVDYYETLKVRAAEKKEERLKKLRTQIKEMTEPVKAALRKNGAGGEAQKLDEEGMAEMLRAQAQVAIDTLGEVQESRDEINLALASGVDGQAGIRPGATWERENKVSRPEKLETEKRENLLATLNNRQRREKWIADGKSKRKKQFGGKTQPISLGDRFAGGLFGNRPKEEPRNQPQHQAKERNQGSFAISRDALDKAVASYNETARVLDSDELENVRNWQDFKGKFRGLDPLFTVVSNLAFNGDFESSYQVLRMLEQENESADTIRRSYRPGSYNGDAMVERLTNGAPDKMKQLVDRMFK